MRGLARLAMRGPFAAALTTAAFALLALVFAPALLISGGLLGLVTLRHGALAGLRTLAIAGAFCGGVIFAVSGRLGLAAAAIAAVWLPVWGASLTLRRTGRQGQALVNIGICVIGYAAMMRFAKPDVGAFWRERLRLLGEVVEAEGGKFLSAEQIEMYGNVMHAASVALLLIAFAAMLLLGRWWQASLYNEGGFRSEFHALTLPRWISTVGAVLALSSLAMSWRGKPIGLAEDAIVVLVLMFSLQGLAILHAVSAAKALSKAWLVGTYVLLSLVPQIVLPILATTGIADLLVDFRRRVRSDSKP